MQNLKNILLMRLGGVGDVVTITPAVRAVRRTFPSAHVALIAETPALDVLTGSPWVDEFIEFTALYRCQTIAGALSSARLKDAVRFARAVHGRDWDALLVLQSAWRVTATIKPRITASLSRAPVVAGLDTNGNGTFLTHKVPDDRFAPRHYIHRYMDVARTIGCEPDGTRPQVWITDEHRREALALLQQCGVADPSRIVGIHPGANPDFGRRGSWPEERFAAVADALISRHNCRVIVTGSGAERELCRRLRDSARCRERIADLSGRTNVKQLAACIEKCRLYISNDTGPMHMGVAVGTPTVGIFGPGDWQCYGTYPAEIPFRMVRADVDCWPCGNVHCRTRRCFELIPTERVLSAAEELLSGS